jgi:rare lipoprotein A (peptidoglycan hydrolase)
MHQVKGEKMKNSLIILVLITSLLPSLTLAKAHKTTHHVVVKKDVPKHVKKESVKHSKVKMVVKHPTKKSTKNIGLASYYGRKFHGKPTASGEIFNQNALTAAHRSIPLQSKVKVTNLKNNKSVVVKINDRGPWVKNRIMDLSKGAAKEIGIDGVQRVSLEVVGK